MERTTKTTKGRKITFTIDEDYVTIENSEKKKDSIFNGVFSNMLYCVAYTKVKHDIGSKIRSLYGSPSIMDFDNGLVGYQCFDFYNNENEAKDRFNSCSKLDDKYDGTKYCDIMLIKNKKVVK